MKIIKKILIALLIVFIVMQIFGPKKNLGDLASVKPFIEETKMPKHVQTIFENTCFDCHSDSTRYPWYDKITPVNYWLANHVEDGKKHFNASIWDGYSIKKKDHKLDELIEEVEKKGMPLESYTYLHTDAKLTDAEIDVVVPWAKSVRAEYTLK